MAEEMSRKPYVRPITPEWITRHPRYIRYMVRELSCLFIMGYTFVLIVGLKSLAEGPAAYEAFLAGLRTPLSIAFHVVAIAFATYHSVTWFLLAPKAMPLQRGEEFVPAAVISGAHFAGWVVLSLALLFLAGAF